MIDDIPITFYVGIAMFIVCTFLHGQVVGILMGAHRFDGLNRSIIIRALGTWLVILIAHIASVYLLYLP